MRGAESGQQVLFSYVAIDARIPADHPLRAMRALLERVLADLAPRFATMYADGGRPSIPPEQLLRALLLQVLYTIRSERQLIEQLEYNLLFRWFVGLGMDETVWHPTTFTKNRDRMLAAGVAEGFFAAVVRQADTSGLLSREHFTVDGTLLEAWASQKSVRRKGDDGAPPNAPPGGGPVGRNTSADFHGDRRTNATHASVTDPDARMARKGPGKPSVLAYQASVTTDNRHGLVVATAVGVATGIAEVEQAEQMLSALSPEPAGRTGHRTVGADKLYDQQGFVRAARALAFAPHVAQVVATPRRGSRIDGRTTRHPGYAESQRRRKLVEESFGWGKAVGLLRKLRHRGVALVDWVFTFTMGIYNLVRLRTLRGAGVCT